MAASLLAFIDTNLPIYDNVSASDGDNALRRARWTAYANRSLQEIWLSGDYMFTYTTGTVSVSNGATSGDLPSDHLEFGDVGGLWEPWSNLQLEEIRPVTAYGASLQGSGSLSGAVATWGMNSSTHRKQLYLPQAASGTQSIPILYRKMAPTLVDSAESTDATSNLWQLPEAYHDTVLLPKLLTYLRKDQGDARQYEADYQRGLSNLFKRERPRKTTPQKPPSSIRIW